MRKKWMAVVVGVLIVLPGLASAQTEWVADPGNPVVPPADTGAWDYTSYVNSVVLVDGTYHLYYMGRAEGTPLTSEYDIGHATSPDGTNWTKDPANPVLVRGSAGEWDSQGVIGAAVIHDGTEFRMWYGGSEGGGVGYATSPDGTTWTKHASNPIMGVGPAGSFDDGSAVPGTVLFDGQTYRMWYTGTRISSGFIWTIGYAESDDGLSWTRQPEPVVVPKADWENWLTYAPSVVYDGSVFRMWYAGAESTASGNWFAIGHATSSNGIEWDQYWDNPVIDPGVALDFPSALYDSSSGLYRLWATNLSLGGFDAFTSECCTTVHASIIPAAAFAAGAEGSFYETDLDLANAGTSEAEYRFSWLPRGANNGDPVQSELFTLGAGQSVRYSNVLAEVFDLEPDAFGALRIDATGPDLNAVVRIANTPQQPDAGSFGQAIVAIRPDDCTGTDERRRLLFGTENDEMRFNVGCLNASDTAARVSFELYSSDGTLIGSESLVLLPWSNNQLNRIFGGHEPVIGYVDYWNALPTPARVYCYGSLLDNVTSDPTTISPK